MVFQWDLHCFQWSLPLNTEFGIPYEPAKKSCTSQRRAYICDNTLTNAFKTIQVKRKLSEEIMSRPLWISAIQEKNYVESYLKSYSETWFFLHTVTGFLERLYFCGFWYLYCDMGRVNGGNFVI